MAPESKSRHEQLLQAGWRYDAATDRYAAPGSPADGTARTYNLEAAWQAHQMNLATEREQPPAKGRADPRKQEPQ